MEPSKTGVTIKLKALDGMKRLRQLPEDFLALKFAVEAFVKTLASEADASSCSITYRDMIDTDRKITNDVDYQTALQEAVAFPHQVLKLFIKVFGEEEKKEKRRGPKMTHEERMAMIADKKALRAAGGEDTEKPPKVQTHYKMV